MPDSEEKVNVRPQGPAQLKSKRQRKQAATQRPKQTRPRENKRANKRWQPVAQQGQVQEPAPRGAGNARGRPLNQAAPGVTTQGPKERPQPAHWANTRGTQTIPTGTHNAPTATSVAPAAIPTGAAPAPPRPRVQTPWPRRGARGGRNYQRNGAINANLAQNLQMQQGENDALRQVIRDGTDGKNAGPPAPTTEELYRTLSYKARMWFLNKDLKSNRDYMIVRHQVLQAGRHCGLHDKPGSMDRILRIVTNAHKIACEERIVNGMETRRANTPGTFMQGLMLKLPETPMLPHESPIDRVTRLEATEPYSMTAGNVYVLSGLFLRCLAGAALEETVKCIYDRNVLTLLKTIAGYAPTRYFQRTLLHWTQKLTTMGGPILGIASGLVSSKKLSRAIASVSEWASDNQNAGTIIPRPLPEAPHILSRSVSALFDIVNPFWYISKYEAQGNFKQAIARHVAHTGLMCLSRTVLGLPGAILAHTIYNFASCILTESKAAMLDVASIHAQSRVREDLCLDHLQIKPVQTQALFKYQQFEQRCKPGFATRTLFGVDGFRPEIHRNCHHNEVISLEGRVGKKLPMHESPELMLKVKKRWRRTKTVRQHMVKLLGEVEPLKFKDWLTKFKAPQKLLFSGIYENKEYYDKWSADTFGKREKALHAVYTFLYVFYKDPRTISACPKWMVSKAGRWIRAIAKSICANFRPECAQDVREGKHIVYTCGLSNQDIGEAFTKASRIVSEFLKPGEHLMFIEDDQSRFDLHLTEGAFVTLDHIYRQVMPQSLCYTLRRGVSKAFTMLGNRYSVPYTMQSGWPDTSVADTLLNCVMKFELHGIGGPWITIINGDDSVTITTSGYLRSLGIGNLKKQYADFGMEVSMTASRDYRDVEFCSARFVDAGSQHLLMPKTGKLLARICSDQKDRNPANYAAWARGVAITLNQFGKSDRLLGALGKAIDRNMGEGKIVIERNEYQRFSDGSVELDEFHQDLYYDHYYGLSTGEVDRLVDHLSSLAMPCITTDTQMVNIVTQDC